MLSKSRFVPTWSMDSVKLQSKSQQVVLWISTTISKVTGTGKRPGVAGTILEDKNKVGRLMLPSFKNFYKSTAIKTVWHWQIDK